MIQCSAKGLNSEETGRLLGIDEGTVRRFRTLAYSRLDAVNSAHAVAIAIRKGLIEA